MLEASTLLLWHAGPMQQIWQFDYLGLFPEDSLAIGGPIIFLVATILLLTLAVAGRSRQIKT